MGSSDLVSDVAFLTSNITQWSSIILEDRAYTVLGAYRRSFGCVRDEYISSNLHLIFPACVKHEYVWMSRVCRTCAGPGVVLVFLRNVLLTDSCSAFG